MTAREDQPRPTPAILKRDPFRKAAKEYAETHILGQWGQDLLAEMLADFAAIHCGEAGAQPPQDAREVAATAYQIIGALLEFLPSAPVRILDYFSAVAQGENPVDPLPFSPDELLATRSTPSPELGKCQYWPVEPHPDCGCNYCHSQRESRLSQPTPSPDSPPRIVSAPELAQKFHEAYERLAPQFGYETRKESAKPWAEVPENNRQLMTAVCAEILAGASSSNAALQTQVDTLKQCWKQEEDGRAKEVSELRSEVDGLREALLNYGNHRIFCTMHVWLASTGEPTCNCGWEEVLARLGTESTEETK